jgi:lycopene cyclase domain-containing protein
MHFFYILGLSIGISGLAIIDYRYKLAFWYNWRRTLKTIGAAMAVFIVWDVLGIILGIFFHGSSKYSLPFTIAPEFPLEELFFLFLLTYSALIIYRGVYTWRTPTSS